MNQEEIKQFLYSLDPQEYIDFMKDIHLQCPFKTEELTDEIIQGWISDQDQSMEVEMESKELQKMIVERGEERTGDAREKRQGDLRRIQDMNSKIGVHPLQLFPKEIWMILLNEEMPPEDKHNFREIHEAFHDLTEEKLFGDILFPLIVGFKVERFWNDDDDVPQKPSVFCPLAQYTELRLVSKFLRNAIDRWFEDDLVSKLRSGIKKAQPSGVVLLNLLDVGDYRWSRSMKKKISHPSSADPLRFFTRSLALVSKVEENSNESWYSYASDTSDDDDEDNDSDGSMVHHIDVQGKRWADYATNIDEILDQIGDQIWYFSFEFHSIYYAQDLNPPNFQDRYTSFLGWLQRMPNLKWLRICISPIQKDYRYQYQIPEGVLPPKMVHLQRLDFELDEDTKYVMPVYYQFLAANTHVKILNLIGLKYVLNEKNGFVGPNATTPLALEVLNFDGCAAVPTGRPRAWRMECDSDSEDDENEDREIFDDDVVINSIVSSKWPLRQIDWCLSGEAMTMDIYNIFRALGSTSTLEKIRLSVPDIIINDDIAFLKLPKLKEFELDFDCPYFGEDIETINHSFFFGLQFLLHAKKLKSLSWKCDMSNEVWEKVRSEVKDREMVGFGGGLGEMGKCESNIWRVFPWLDEINLTLKMRMEKYSSSGMESVEKVYRRREIEVSKNSARGSSSTPRSSLEGKDEK